MDIFAIQGLFRDENDSIQTAKRDVAVVGGISRNKPVLDSNVMTHRIRDVKIGSTLMTLNTIKSNVYYNDVAFVIFSKVIYYGFSAIWLNNVQITFWSSCDSGHFRSEIKSVTTTPPIQIVMVISCNELKVEISKVTILVLFAGRFGCGLWILHGVKCIIVRVSIISSVNRFLMEICPTYYIVWLNWNDEPQLRGFMLVGERPWFPDPKDNVFKIRTHCKCLAYCTLAARDISDF